MRRRPLELPADRPIAPALPVPPRCTSTPMSVTNRVKRGGEPCPSCPAIEQFLAAWEEYNRACSAWYDEFDQEVPDKARHPDVPICWAAL